MALEKFFLENGKYADKVIESGLQLLHFLPTRVEERSLRQRLAQFCQLLLPITGFFAERRLLDRLPTRNSRE